MIINNIFILTSFIIISCGLIRFSNNRKHLLNILLRLEFIILGIFFLISGCLSIVGRELYCILIFLTLAACEGALGLSILILIVCFYGNDYFNRTTILKC